MDIFDHMHREHFDQLFGLDEQTRKQLAEWARQDGCSEEEIAQILSGLMHKGQTFCHAHAVDAMTITERAIYAQDAQSITLKISREGDEETYDGHLHIEILEVVRDSESLQRAIRKNATQPKPRRRARARGARRGPGGAVCQVWGTVSQALSRSAARDGRVHTAAER